MVKKDRDKEIMGFLFGGSQASFLELCRRQALKLACAPL